MKNLAVRARELLSSNVDTLLDKATNPAKMLGLLLTEVEENLIDLHGDLAKAVRAEKRLVAQAERTASDAEGWTAKAKVAVDHGREDLARAALLARESGRQEAAELAAEAEAAGEEVNTIEAAIAEMDAKRRDVLARMRDIAPAAGGEAAKDSKTDARMDRIDALERRVGFGTADGPSQAAIGAEIADLEKASALDAELAAMKAPAKKPARKKAK
jgi:phage shock protein A